MTARLCIGGPFDGDVLADGTLAKSALSWVDKGGVYGLSGGPYSTIPLEARVWVWMELNKPTPKWSASWKGAE
jgi:hypothetical protein